MIGCHSLVYELDEKGSAQSAGMKAAIGVVAVGQGVLCMGQIGQQHSILVHISKKLVAACYCNAFDSKDGYSRTLRGSEFDATCRPKFVAPTL